MADNTRAAWAPFLYELQGKVVEVFPTEGPLLAEFSGVGDPNAVGRFTQDMDGNRQVFSGSAVRISVILANLQGAGAVTESQTWNVPYALSSTNTTNVRLTDNVVPFTLSIDVEQDSFDNSSATAVATLLREARVSLARMENSYLNGDGTGKVSDIVSGSSPGLSINISTTGLGQLDQLLPGTIWDIKTKSTGANPGNGNRRLIASVSDSSTTQTVVFSTAQQASDGDSGNITFSTNEGIYYPGSWSNGSTPGTNGPGDIVMLGLEAVAATTGTIEGINKSNVVQWQGTDGRQGDTTVLDLSTLLLDKAVRVGRRAAIGVWDFGVGDPTSIDRFKQALYNQMRFDVATQTLKSGYSGIVYDGADKPFPLIKDPMHKKGALKLVDKSSFQLYGNKAGPQFLDDDGSMFRRFSRTMSKEADLIDRVQFAALKCNTLVFLNNLTGGTV
jgi:hypothetical protein